MNKKVYLCKRIVAFVLACLLILPGFVSSVYASESEEEIVPEYAKIRVITQDSSYQLGVYAVGREIMFQAKDLALITGYQYGFDDGGGKYTDTVFYTRNAKIIEIYTKYGELWQHVGDECVEGVIFDTMPLKIKGEWYLPGSEVLPWLNVFSVAKNGCLYVYSDAVSYYDIIDDFDMDDFEFNFTDACEAIGVNSQNLTIATFFERQGISGTLKHTITFDGDDPFKSYGSYKTFCSVLENFIADRTAAAEAMEIIEDAYGIIDINSSFWEQMSKAEFLPVDADFFDSVGEGVTLIEMGSEIAQFYTLYNQDNSIKLGIMKRIWDGDYTDIHNENTEKAAKTMYKAYTDYWYGLLFTAGGVLEDEIIDNLVEKAIGYVTGTELLNTTLDAVELVTKVTVSWDEAVDNIRVHKVIAPSAQTMFEDYYDDYDYLSGTIEDKIGSAILYLYCKEQCYLAMNQYMYETRHYDDATYKEFQQLAAEAKEWQGKFLAAYESRLNDSTNMNSFGENGILRDDYESYYKDEFEKLEFLKEAPMELAYIEYAFVLQGLKDNLGYDDYQWLIMDIDGDGGKELVVGLDFETSGYPAQLLCDAGSVTTWYHQRRSADGISMYVAAADGSTIYLNDGGNSIDYITDNYFRWNGTGWEKTGRLELEGVDSGGEYTFDNGGLMNQYNGDVSWNGESLSVDEYYSRVSNEITTLTYDCPNLSDFTIRGDSTALLNEIESYFKSRNSYYASGRGDINQDGDEDLLVAIDDAVEYWFGYIESETGCFENFADYEKQYLTILAAETVQEGVRIRFVNRPKDGVLIKSTNDYILNGTTLTIGTLVLHYNENGLVYTAEEDNLTDDFEVDIMDEYTEPMDDIGIDDYPDLYTSDEDLPEEEAVTLMELVFMEKKGVRRSLEAYQDQGMDLDYGSLYQTPVTITYDSDGIVDTVIAENNGGYAQIVGAFPLDSTFGELWYMIPSISDWSEPVVTEGGYVTTFVYQEPVTGLEAYCELVFDGIEEDSSVKMIYIEFLK